MQVLSHGKERLLVQTIAYHASQTSKYMIASCTTGVIDSGPTVKVWSTAISPELDIFNVEHVTSNVDTADTSAIAPFVIFAQSTLWTLLVAMVGMACFSLCASRNGGSHISPNVGLEPITLVFFSPSLRSWVFVVFASMEPEPSGSAEYSAYHILADSRNNSNTLITAPAAAQSQPANFSPWSAPSFNFPPSDSHPFSVNDGKHAPHTPRLRPLVSREGSFSSTASSHSVVSLGSSGLSMSDSKVQRPSSSFQPMSLPAIHKGVPSHPSFPWSHSQWLGGNIPVVPSQQGMNLPNTVHNGVTPTVASGADLGIPQAIQVGPQASLGDVSMNPGSQRPLHHEHTEGASVSKKRKSSANSRGKAKCVSQLFNPFVSPASIFQHPGQLPRPFPDWPNIDCAAVSANSSTGLNPSGQSIAAGSGTVVSSAAPVSGSPADFSFAPFLKFFSESMNHLVSTLESNQLSVQRTMKEQQQQFSSQLQLLHAKLAQTAPAASPGQSSPRASHYDGDDGDDVLPIPQKKKKKRTNCRFLENAHAVDSDIDMVTYNQFLQYIRDHLLALLGIKDLKNIADAKDRCTISEQENEAFNRDLPGSIQITANDFRLDLSRNRSTLFNRTAMEVFAEDFYQKVTRDGWYKSPPIPVRYLQVDTISDCFYYHLKHVKSRYNHFVIGMACDSVAARAKEEKRLQKVSRGVRKVRLYKWRLDAIASDPQLSKHQRLLEALGTQGMSSDESDTETPGRSTTYPRIYPKWRSQQLSTFLWQLDAIVEKIHASPVGRRKRGGNPLRIRPHTSKYNTAAAAPPFHAREDDLRGHSESVTCLAFSPLGDCLASGGEDGNIIVWDPLKGTLLHRVPVSGAITSMAWDPDDSKHRIFVGTANGTIFAINDFDCVPEQGLDSCVLTGVDTPVYAIAIDTYSGVLALGMGSEVHLAKWVAPNHYATFKILPPPPELPNTPQDTDKRVRVRALAFREGGHHLLATYLSHGIVCWDLVHPQTQLLWTTVPMHSHRLIGHSLLSPDEQALLIYNLSEGMDLYKIHTGENIPVQVTFLHDGRAAACGSTDGNVMVWDIANEDQIQVLPHDAGTGNFGKLDALCAVPVDWPQAYQYRHFALLAAGTSHSSENTYIRIWRSDTRSSRTMIRRLIHRKVVRFSPHLVTP
ncbi:hypothetical protein EDC04DRAFT_2894716 [Pisolithus marmoratus]|nr:hypothetical protein EDC04DRAFT_2894716 [Pisolithus marmoratus]